METQVEQLMGRLRDAEFRKKLLAVCGDTMSLAAVFFDDGNGDPAYDYLKGDWQESLGTAMGVYGWIPDILEERTKSLSNPRIIAPGELWGEFEVYLEHECHGVSD